MIIRYDSLNDLFSDESKCPQCNKALKKLFASGKYEDIVNFGHKTKLNTSKITKKEVKITRSFKIEDIDISIDYMFDTKNNSMKVRFQPSEDELVERFGIAQGFYELEAARYNLAQNEGLIHIWGILRRAQEAFFVVQECELHYRRISVLNFDEDGEKIEEIVSYDNFLYSPTFKVENQYFVVHTHTSSRNKKKTMSIHTSDKSMIDNLDPLKGYVFLKDPEDATLMKFDPSDTQKFARRLSTICALKG